MKKQPGFFHPLLGLAVLLASLTLAWAQTPAAPPVAAQATPPAKTGSTAAQPAPQVCAACIRAHMEFLASDALRGRGSGTHDELVAAIYIASELHRYGIEPFGDSSGYLQRVPLVSRQLSASPQLKFMTTGDTTPAEQIAWTHGKEMLVLRLAQPDLSGPLQKIELGEQELKPQVERGAFVLLKGKPGASLPGYEEAQSVLQAGAAAVLVPETPQFRAHWQGIAQRLFADSPELADATGARPDEKTNLIVLSKDASAMLDHVPEGTVLQLVAPMEPPKTAATWNVVGEIRGSDAGLRREAVVFSAHLDHLGVGKPVQGDDIYNGADDDASGVTAVLELARMLGAGPRPRRTVIFVLFGSEESGGLGSRYFREHPPLPLEEISADLEFEMIGRTDPAVAPDTLWLTGWERSNFGPALAAHGAKLVADPHPDQHFFARSDNYVLAKKGVVAQTISSFGLHKDYHQPSDDLAHIDFHHMTEAIRSLLAPVEWLVNSEFTPRWNKGGQP